MTEAPPVFLTFDTTQHALWAEEIAREEGVPCEVVPAPPGKGARCDLVLKVLPNHAKPLSEALSGAGIVFTLHGP